MPGPAKLASQARFVLLIVVLAVASRASAAQLSGTVTYNGSMGPVSSSRPILLQLVENGAAAVVTANGGAFTFDGLAAGNYTLVYVLDLNNDGRISVGEPGLIYNNRQNFPGDPVAVPGPALTLQLNDAFLVPGISGTATYTGTKGTVSNATRIRVHAYSDANLTNFANTEGRTKVNGGRYDVVSLDGNALYLRAFLDLNGNDKFDAGEPFEIYNDKGAPPGDAIVPGAHQTNINFTFGDENVGGSQPTPTPTPPPSVCIGDCNDDGMVTVDELLTLVNIALDTADIGACLAGDANHDNHITIDEILTAVRSALNGCLGS